jgi:hypothetical protein
MTDRTERLPAVLDRVIPFAGLSARVPVSTRTLAGACALVPVALSTLYRVVNNAPGTLPTDLAVVAASARPAAMVGPAVAALLLAGDESSPARRVGLAFAGGFGVLALVSPAAWLPAAAGIVAGGVVLVVAHARDAPTVERAVWGAAVGGVLVIAAGVSLLATVGIDPATLRPLGSTVALVGVGTTPLLTGRSRLGLVAGALAAGSTVAVAVNAPFVAGAVLLVGGGVVAAPLGLVALAVGGGVVGLVAAVESRKRNAAFGVCLLLAAGVPSTLVRAVAVVVAVALLTDSDPSLPPCASTPGGVAS